VKSFHQPGDSIAQRYRIIAPLGQGAFSTTYQAEDLINHQSVAIKALSLKQIRDWKVLELFEREARVLAYLDHPAIPKYLDYFHADLPDDCLFYLVQELVAGTSLAEQVAQGWRGGEDEVKQIAIHGLNILHYLRSLKPPVIHRDIKPQNLIQRPDGQLCLVDFGAVQDIYRNTLTRGGTFVGTLGYMAPEQLRGQVSFASDLYALGATLLFLLTQRSPDAWLQYGTKANRRWRRLPISPAFSTWLQTALAPAAEDRFQSATAALAALPDRSALARTIAAPGRPQPHRSSIAAERPARRTQIPASLQGWRKGLDFLLEKVRALHQPADIIAQRYWIIDCLGQGAFGTTYQANDLVAHRSVAIKVMSLRQLQEWKVLELFEREARVLAYLDHPAIPKYLDYFHEDTPEDRKFYLVQELVAGKSLADLVKQGWHCTEAEVTQIALQVLGILNYLHNLRPPVIHRDIKPQNLIRRTDGQICLVDFGAVQDIYRSTLARSDTFVGTVDYMPLEQLRGQAYFASDLYALGATLVFLLTHRSPAELSLGRMQSDLSSRLQVSPQFADWLAQLLQPAVEDRFKSAAGSLKELHSQSAAAIPRLLDTREGMPSPVSQSALGTARLPEVGEQQLDMGPPLQTRVVLFKTDDYLSIHIPSVPCTVWCFYIWLVPLGTLSHRIAIRFFTKSLLFWASRLLVLIFVLAGLGLLWSMLKFLWFTIVLIPEIAQAILGPLFCALYLGVLSHQYFLPRGEAYFEINRHAFRLRQGFLGMNHYVGGESKNINAVRLSSLDSLILEPACTIWEERHRYDFGYGLTLQEKQWLVAEIQDFLARMDD